MLSGFSGLMATGVSFWAVVSRLTSTTKRERADDTEKLGATGELFYPSPRLATDNGAMIARTALFHFEQGDVAPLDLTARADLPFPGLVCAS